MEDWIKKNWKIALMLVVGIIVAYASVLFLGKDNIIEQDIEQVIESETGLKVDLTP